MKLILIFTIVIILLANFSCKKISDSIERPCSPFDNITETDVNGNLVGKIDNQDWISSNILNIIPAYPNPSKPVCTISFELSEKAMITITVNKTSKTIVRTLVADTLNAGQHSLIWDGKDESEKVLPNCLYRIYFSVRNKNTSYNSFGDVKLVTNEN